MAIFSSGYNYFFSIPKLTTYGICPGMLKLFLTALCSYIDPNKNVGLYSEFDVASVEILKSA